MQYPDSTQSITERLLALIATLDDDALRLLWRIAAELARLKHVR